jgi:hypothetical protein
MRTSLLASLLLLAPITLSAQARATQGQRNWVSVDAPVVALTHVQVVDGTGAAPAADQTIIITGDKITAVGPTP